MKIIDFKRKGNVVRFYLGEHETMWGWTNKEYKDYTGKIPAWLKPSDTYYGDDWNDAPYEHNAGEVYEEFIKGYKDIKFDFEDIVLEPSDGEFNCEWSKDDMVARKVPCIVVIPKALKDKLEIKYDWELDNFSDALSIDGATKYYFGDEI